MVGALYRLTRKRSKLLDIAQQDFDENSLLTMKLKLDKETYLPLNYTKSYYVLKVEMKNEGEKRNKVGARP